MIGMCRSAGSALMRRVGFIAVDYTAAECPSGSGPALLGCRSRHACGTVRGLDQLVFGGAR